MDQSETDLLAADAGSKALIAYIVDLLNCNSDHETSYPTHCMRIPADIRHIRLFREARTGNVTLHARPEHHPGASRR